MNLVNPALCGYKGDNKESRGIALQSQSTWIRPESGKWKIPRSDRSQVIGRKLLIGKLAPWVTGDI